MAYGQIRGTVADETGAQRRASGRPSAKVRRVSIEVSNESGIDVSEEELISVARFVISQDESEIRRPSFRWCCSTPRRWADLHMRWDGSAPARPT